MARGIGDGASLELKQPQGKEPGPRLDLELQDETTVRVSQGTPTDLSVLQGQWPNIAIMGPKLHCLQHMVCGPSGVLKF